MELTDSVELIAGERYLLGRWDPIGNTDVLLFNPTDAVTFDAPISLDITPNSTGYTRDTESTTEISEPWGVGDVGSHIGVNFKYEIVPDVIAVDIDIKPGSYPNSINLGSNGAVPVAILSSLEFDATTVDPATVTLAGAGVAIRGKGERYLASEEDVDGDGLLDLSLKVETENLDPNIFQDGWAYLTGTTYDGQDIDGLDEITIVPPQ
jgi:hypothetical protein